MAFFDETLTAVTTKWTITAKAMLTTNTEEEEDYDEEEEEEEEAGAIGTSLASLSSRSKAA